MMIVIVFGFVWLYFGYHSARALFLHDANEDGYGIDALTWGFGLLSFIVPFFTIPVFASVVYEYWKYFKYSFSLNGRLRFPRTQSGIPIHHLVAGKLFVLNKERIRL